MPVGGQRQIDDDETRLETMIESEEFLVAVWQRDVQQNECCDTKPPGDRKTGNPECEKTGSIGDNQPSDACRVYDGLLSQWRAW